MMDHEREPVLYGAVYEPPSPEFPFVVVVLRNGDIIDAKSAASIAQGEALLEKLLTNFEQLPTPDDGGLGCDSSEDGAEHAGPGRQARGVLRVLGP